MKRGFEENVPKIRPRVRLGHALDEQLEEAQQVAASESVAPPIETAPPDVVAVPAPDPSPLPTPEPLPLARRIEPPPARKRRALATNPAAEVAELAKELTGELNRAADVNARLKADLDAALAGLRQAADESEEQRAEAARLTAELEKRTAALAEVRGEIELLEAERDGALAQSARLSRDLREQRDQARKELEEARAERDRLAAQLLQANADADEAAQSRSALEEIHQALAAARSRITGIR